MSRKNDKGQDQIVSILLYIDHVCTDWVHFAHSFLRSGASASMVVHSPTSVVFGDLTDRILLSPKGGTHCEGVPPTSPAGGPSEASASSGANWWMSRIWHLGRSVGETSTAEVKSFQRLSLGP